MGVALRHLLSSVPPWPWRRTHLPIVSLHRGATRFGEIEICKAEPKCFCVSAVSHELENRFSLHTDTDPFVCIDLLDEIEAP